MATSADAATVGGGVIPPGAQGVHLGGKRSFGTAFARVIGINTFDASADATAVTGRLTGGAFLPVVFPINIVDCEKNGDLGTGEVFWSSASLTAPTPAWSLTARNTSCRCARPAVARSRSSTSTLT